MKRLKVIFAVPLILLALPFWRFMDLIAIVSPFEVLLTIAMVTYFAAFFALPVKLLFPKIKPLILLGSILLLGLSVFFTGPISKQASLHPELNHCGKMTYTGFFYPIRNFVTDAHRDDLEARNQLCWLRKLISKVPEKFDNEDETKIYADLTQDKLFKPEIKYRVTLPLMALLYIKIYTAQIDNIEGKKIYDSLHFWFSQYTEEISQREYSWWNWPHSEYMIWEYGLIEKNWEKLIDSIVFQQY